MSVLDIIGLAGYLVAVLALIFCARCYRELHRWARLCQETRIAIAYNNRVKMQAPFTEWMQWAGMLADDEQSTGRVVYRANKVSVAIAGAPPAEPHALIREILKALTVKLAGLRRGTTAAA